MSWSELSKVAFIEPLGCKTCEHRRPEGAIDSSAIVSCPRNVAVRILEQIHQAANPDKGRRRSMGEWEASNAARNLPKLTELAGACDARVHLNGRGPLAISRVPEASYLDHRLMIVDDPYTAPLRDGYAEAALARAAASDLAIRAAVEERPGPGQLRERLSPGGPFATDNL